VAFGGKHSRALQFGASFVRERTPQLGCAILMKFTELSADWRRDLHRLGPNRVGWLDGADRLCAYLQYIM
jgi:hypothetical protein